jgi:sulfatase maturation enzyme AslB (radical SAM superfamily)
VTITHAGKSRNGDQMPIIAISEHAATSLRQFCDQMHLKVRDLVLYVTSACNLRCSHCYVGNELLDSANRYRASFLAAILDEFSPLDRLTVLGGEPLLYADLNSLLNSCSLRPIGERRLTTNLSIWREDAIQRIADSGFRLVVSLDGARRDTHELYRGKGTYDVLIANLRKARSIAKDMEITTTISRLNAPEFPELVILIASLGIDRLNLHSMSIQGNALGMQSSAMAAGEWVRFRDAIVTYSCSASSHVIIVRVPWLLATDSELRELTERGEYHSHAQGSFYSTGHRLVLYPNGRVFISSENFGSEYYLGTLYEGEFIPNQMRTSELELDLNEGKSPSDYRHVHHTNAQFNNLLSVSYKRTVAADPTNYVRMRPGEWDEAIGLCTTRLTL